MKEKNYIIYGSEYSPFSVKVRSYFRFKRIPHEWRPRTRENFADFQAHAKLPLVPLIICPDGTVLQDSTPIMEKMEAQHPEFSTLPDMPELTFLSALLEEYGDEWGNKPMFHYRWWREVDQIAVSEGLAEAIMPKAGEEEHAAFSRQLRERMVPRLSFVGSSEQNKELIEESLTNYLELLEAHLVNRPYLFGGRPCFGDFGMFCQLYGCTQQPTTAPMIEAHPHIAAWIDRMLSPETTGDWEDWNELSATLMPLLKTQVGELYLPWALANAKALKGEEATFTVTLKGTEFTQDTMKYTGRSFQTLKNRFAALQNRQSLEDILLSVDCLKPLVQESW